MWTNNHLSPPMNVARVPTMTRRVWYSSLAAVLAIVASLVLNAQRPATMAGVWDVTISNPAGDPLREKWTLQQHDAAVTGTVLTQRGTEVPVKGTLGRNKINLTVMAKMPNGETRELK